MTEPAGATGTLALADIEALDLSALRPAAYAAERGGNILQNASETVDDALEDTLQTWAGAAADAADASARHMTAQIMKSARRATRLGRAIRDGYSQMIAARARLLAVASDLNAQGLFIDADAGTVRAGADAADTVSARRGSALLRQALREFSTVDADAAASVDAAADSATADTFGAGIDGPFAEFYRRAQAMAELPSPPQGTTPAANHEFWESLSGDEQAELVEVRPAAVGGMDGIPAVARHRANIMLLDNEQQRLQAEQQRLTKASAHSPSRFVYGLGSGIDEKLTRVTEKLDDVAAIRKITAKNPAARLMLLDLKSGKYGKAAIAVGDPDTADHISVTVPGDTTTVRGSMGGMVEEAEALRAETTAQLASPAPAAATAGANPTGSANPTGGETVASIAWIGYHAFDLPNDLTEAPSSLIDLVTDDLARDGAADLAPFLDGLRVASENADPHITALGHSYGSLTTSFALQDAAVRGAVDDAVFYGSPGLRADSAADLGLADHHAYVLEADDDPVADVGNAAGIFGLDPGSSDGFDHLSTDQAVTDDGIARADAHGHSEYARPDAGGTLRTSAYNMAAVVSGRLDHAVYD